MKTHFSSRTMTVFILLLGIILLSVAPLIVRWSTASGVVTSFYRMFIASVVITLINFFRKKTVKTHSFSWRVLLLPVLAGISSGIDHSLWSTAIQNTYVTKANLLNYIAPLWVGLSAVFILREKYSKIFWFGLSIVLLGAWAISGARIDDFSTIRFNGEGFAFFSSFFYAGYMLLSERSRLYFNSLSFVQISSFAASLVLGIITLVFGYSFFGYSQQTYLLFLTVGLLSQVGGYFCLVYSLRKISASIVSSVLVLQPVLTALWASLFFKEDLNLSQLMGGVLVLVGIYVISLSKPKDKLVIESG